eukprot:gnl/TRDRNA2_/TRDRNA2_153901_c3_seq1.p1 gnl/TRDRNA2_/TRDRNA2_153901_c3~~gnl/TRDRNA2_/TRDRNA2_153901_c3_seq1.p1  ORF type:complete len:310 (-),score=34.64 gnl/TRDRNA2_/TRDRNA2_153901_c3_seq1:335-1141(-)
MLAVVQFQEIMSPQGDLLWKDVRLEIPREKFVLISGPEGCGKTALCKAIKGVWPFISGGQLMLSTGKDSILVVPQKPCLPPRCTLAQALAYPDVSTVYSDDDMVKSLTEVGLAFLLKDEDSEAWGTNGAQTPRPVPTSATPRGLLIPRAGDSQAPSPRNSKDDGAGLHRVAPWLQILSPAALQRLTICHILLKGPMLSFLDESFGGIVQEAVPELYALLKKSLPKGASVVHVSHDVDTMAPLHDIHLKVEGEGCQKRLERVSESKPSS